VKTVKVMHITDTLIAGGKERVAVNLSNLLQTENYQGHLCTTRSEGPLDLEVRHTVGRLRLFRKRRFDFLSLVRLTSYIRVQQIDVLHAHGPSLFMAILASLFPPFPAVVWHDHYGKYALKERSVLIYRLLSKRLKGVITVNEPLAEWSRKKLKIPEQRVWYLPNCIFEKDEIREKPYDAISLPGVAGSRIVCVANLRPQKAHVTLVRAMKAVVSKVPHAQLLVVGSPVDGRYFKKIQEEVLQLGIGENVSFLGERQDIPQILRASAVGVLSSASEGFPLVLLEYGAASLPAVATSVGQCVEILDQGHAGRLVPPHSPDELSKAILSILESPDQGAELGRRLNIRCQELFNPETLLKKICHVYDAVLRQT